MSLLMSDESEGQRSSDFQTPSSFFPVLVCCTAAHATSLYLFFSLVVQSKVKEPVMPSVVRLGLWSVIRLMTGSSYSYINLSKQIIRDVVSKEWLAETCA